MILHGFVPNNFGLGLVIPLIKDKTGNPNRLSNYRGITLIAVISMVFEAVLLNVCDSHLMADDLQFGFKKGLDCDKAIFSLLTFVSVEALFMPKRLILVKRLIMSTTISFIFRFIKDFRFGSLHYLPTGTVN